MKKMNKIWKKIGEMDEHFNYLKEENNKILEIFKGSQTDMKKISFKYHKTMSSNYCKLKMKKERYIYETTTRMESNAI